MSSEFKIFPLCLFRNHAFDGGGHALGNGDNCPFSTLNLFPASPERLGGAQGTFLGFKRLHLGSTEKRKNPLAALKFCLPSLRLPPLFCVCRVWVTTGGVELVYKYQCILTIFCGHDKVTGTNI